MFGSVIMFAYSRNATTTGEMVTVIAKLQGGARLLLRASCICHSTKKTGNVGVVRCERSGVFITSTPLGRAATKKLLPEIQEDLAVYAESG